MKYRYVAIVGLTIFLSTIGAGLSLAADQIAELKEKVAMLEGRIKQLEGQLVDQKAAANTPPANATANTSSIYGYDDPWDPFVQMDMMNQQMNHLMRHAMASRMMPMFNPKTDIKQSPDHYVITLDVPGMDKNKLNIEVKEGMLIVSGERSSETKEDKANQYYRQERSFGSFMQSYPLPEDAKPDQIDAQYNNGVLTVTIGREKPKDKKQESKKIVVK